MENPDIIHVPVSAALGEPRLFWLLLHELYKSGLAADCDRLLRADWAGWPASDEAQELASRVARLFLSQDDSPRLQTLSEGFSPELHALYFDRLGDSAKLFPQSKRCLGWMQSKSLIGKGLDGFKTALAEGHLELAKALHQPTMAEAQAAFFELAGQLTKESLSFLLFLCPTLASIPPLTHAVHAKAPEDALCFLAWKIEESHGKSALRHPGGDDHLLGSLLLRAMSHRQFFLAKKFLEWDHSLAFDKHEPKELTPPWDGDLVPIKLDGSLSLTAADFACLYAHEGFARALSHVQSPPPTLPKVMAVIAALGKKLDSRRKGAGPLWSQAHLARAELVAHAAWRPAR